MINRIMCILVAGLACLSCSSAGDEPTVAAGESTASADSGADDETGNEMDNRNITITVGGASFAATLADNATAEAFASLLPMTVVMNEYNGNEKYYALPQSLPTDTYRPGTIRTGDLMLWGSATVVLFYDTFSTSYSYTRIGSVDNPEGLAAAVGDGNPTVSFSFR